MSTRENAHTPEVLGNIVAAERPGQKPVGAGEAVPCLAQRERGVLAVRVSFEANRLAATYLATAYEQVLPPRRRGLMAETAGVPGRVERPRAGRVGA